MSEKYAREKTQYSKVITHGFAVGGVGELYKNCIGHDKSCDIFGIIKQKSKFDDGYYKVYTDLSKDKTQYIGTDFFNLSTLFDFDNANYKDKILSCLTCSITSLFGAISYDKLSDNILSVGVAGGIINSAIQTIITGHTHTTDFVFGMIASMVGMQIIRETKELAVEDDVLHPEIL